MTDRTVFVKQLVADHDGYYRFHEVKCPKCQNSKLPIMTKGVDESRCDNCKTEYKFLIGKKIKIMLLLEKSKINEKLPKDAYWLSCSERCNTPILRKRGNRGKENFINSNFCPSHGGILPGYHEGEPQYCDRDHCFYERIRIDRFSLLNCSNDVGYPTSKLGTNNQQKDIWELSLCTGSSHPKDTRAYLKLLI